MDIIEAIKKADRGHLAKAADVDEGVIRRITMGDKVRLTEFLKVAKIVHCPELEAQKYWLRSVKVNKFDIIADLLSSRGLTRNDLVLFTKKQMSLFRDTKWSYSDKTFFTTVEFIESFPPIRELIQKQQRSNHLSDKEMATLLDVSPSSLRLWYNGQRMPIGIRQKCYNLLKLEIKDPPVLTTNKKLIDKADTKPTNPFMLPEAARQDRLKKHVAVAMELSMNTEFLDTLELIHKEGLELPFLLKLSKDFRAYI